MNQFFWPDSAATSQLLTDLATGMVEQGHEVHVICADGTYAAGASGPPPFATDVIGIHRVRTMPFTQFSHGVLGRVLSYLSFYLGALWLGLRGPRPDLVVTLTTPPLLSLLGTLIQAVRGSRHCIWEMDVYPDVAVSCGYFKAGGWLERGVGLLADFSRHRADSILALGECMRNRLIARGIDGGKIEIAENWADGSAIQPVPRPGNQGELVVLYSGNLGLAHDTETIATAMSALKDSDKFRFIFTGGGPRRRELQAFCEQEALPSVEFRSYVQRMSLGESLGAGDIGLVTQKDSCCGMVVPSKVYGLLAAGRPILFIGPADATPARIIRRFHCGWHIACGDTGALTMLLRRLARDRAEVHTAGWQARQVLLNYYDLPIGVARICELLGLNAPVVAREPVATYVMEQGQEQDEELLTGTHS